MGLGSFSAPFPDLAGLTFPLTPQVPADIPLYFYGIPRTGISHTPISGYYVAPNFTAPYDRQYNFGVQYQFHHDWLLETGYVGSKGTKGINVYTVNQVRASTSQGSKLLSMRYKVSAVGAIWS
jgi:hypothetical protein